MEKNSLIYVAGNRGLAGSAIVDVLGASGYNNLVYRTHTELDLRNKSKVLSFFDKVRPHYMFLAAARVGGILANNTYPVDFLYDNLEIQNNLLYASFKYELRKVLFLGSSCIYPRDCPQPMREEHLLTGKLEPTNEPYAIAKIAGIKLCQSFNRQYGTNYIAAMPTNLYGINDNFDPNTSHVLPALISKFHRAKVNKERSITLWGSGRPRREFLHAMDFASACLFLMENFSPSKADNDTGNIYLNIGSGNEISIYDLACMVSSIVGFRGRIEWDTRKPDGTMRKFLSLDRIHSLGWRSRISLLSGIRDVYLAKKDSF